MDDQSLMIPLESVVTGRGGYFCKAKDVFIHIDQQPSTKEPSFKGTPDQYMAFKTQTLSPIDRGELEIQLKNKVRKCPTCSKSNGFTLKQCNSCFSDISHVPLSATDNVFTGFIYGIEKSGITFTISIRHQCAELLVFDDLLRLSACHLNVIPTNFYCPDWRFLLDHPQQGIRTLEMMYAKCWHVTKTQFLSNKDWRIQTFKKQDVTEDELKRGLIVGCNYPPSQFQLHLQFILGPYFPHRWSLQLKNERDMVGRFFPLPYMLAVLKYAADHSLTVDPNSEPEKIIELFNGFGVNYEKFFDQAMATLHQFQTDQANWVPSRFQGFVVDDVYYEIHQDGTNLIPTNEKPGFAQIDVQDVLTMANYGRPYVDGKPTGSFLLNPVQHVLPKFRDYSHPKL